MRIVKSLSRNRQYCAVKCTVDPPTQFAIPTATGALVGVCALGRQVGISRLNFGPPRLLRNREVLADLVESLDEVLVAETRTGLDPDDVQACLA